MNTLDETIELIEKALWCAYLPQDDTTTTAGLALHYLKEYRETKKHLACLDDAEIRGDDTQIINNPALTWQELKQMEGKPVWVEHKHYSKWLIVYEVYENTIVLDGNGFYTQYFSDDNNEEVRWKAYRKERG